MNSILWPKCPWLQTSNKTVTLGSKFLSQIWMPLRLCIINKTKTNAISFKKSVNWEGTKLPNDMNEIVMTSLQIEKVALMHRHYSNYQGNQSSAHRPPSKTAMKWSLLKEYNSTHSIVPGDTISAAEAIPPFDLLGLEHLTPKTMLRPALQTLPALRIRQSALFPAPRHSLWTTGAREFEALVLRWGRGFGSSSLGPADARSSIAATWE